ncbi:unnamed protein product [Calicophoron daubneyi]|uniref:DUF1279 domain-containing protein n=1 Tax=Calicophoron daubneyi TaxID=300641 RepID=A0AAV2T3T9_CALDB
MMLKPLISLWTLSSKPLITRTCSCSKLVGNYVRYICCSKNSAVLPQSYRRQLPGLTSRSVNWSTKMAPFRLRFPAWTYYGAADFTNQKLQRVRLASTVPESASSDPAPKEQPPKSTDEEYEAKKSSLIDRFKKTYAIYGKLVIIIHGLGSCCWLAGAYALASSGINLLGFFEAANFPDWICKPLRMGGGSVNTWATALILYKLIAPLRYGLTIFLTTFTVRYMRSKGKVPQLADRDRLRNLAQESAQLSRERLKFRLSRSQRKATALSKKARRSLASVKKKMRGD